jgi:hypothetical protein
LFSGLARPALVRRRGAQAATSHILGLVVQVFGVSG